MPSTFQDAEYRRVVYRRNPLVEVICQVRFPPVLKIEASSPADFQERIMRAYPNLEIRDGVELTLLQGPSVQPGTPIRQSRSYSFFSPERDWHLSLASNFIALTTGKYERWEAFRARLSDAMSALLRTYQVSHFSRVGLRYTNVIDREALGLHEEPWRNLLKPNVIGWLGDNSADESATVELSSTTVLREGSTNIRTQSSLVENQQTKQRAFLVDNDFYIESSIPASDAEAIRNADELHRHSGPFFRWCIQRKLHDTLGPEEVPIQ